MAASRLMSVLLVLGIAHAILASPTCSGSPGECVDLVSQAEQEDVNSFIQFKPNVSAKPNASGEADRDLWSTRRRRYPPKPPTYDTRRRDTKAKHCYAVDLLALAQMSSLVYDLHSKGKGTIDSSRPEIDDAGFKLAKEYPQPEYEFSPVENGKKQIFIPAFAVWKQEPFEVSEGWSKTVCKRAVIAIKGTDMDSQTDREADINQVLVGFRKPKEALELLTGVVEGLKRDKYTVLVTGHSLGGYMGEVLSTHLDLPGAVFCAPGPNGKFSTHCGGYVNEAFQVVNANKDALGNINYLTYKHNSEPIYVTGNNKHGIDHMVEELKKIPKFCQSTNKGGCTNDNVLEYCKKFRSGYYLNYVK